MRGLGNLQSDGGRWAETLGKGGISSYVYQALPDSDRLQEISLIFVCQVWATLVSFPVYRVSHMKGRKKSKVSGRKKGRNRGDGQLGANTRTFNHSFTYTFNIAKPKQSGVLRAEMTKGQSQVPSLVTQPHVHRDWYVQILYAKSLVQHLAHIWYLANLVVIKSPSQVLEILEDRWVVHASCKPWVGNVFSAEVRVHECMQTH